MNKILEITAYKSENEEHLLYFLEEYVTLCQKKTINHETYDPEKLYGYFRKTLIVLDGNTRDSIIISVEKTKDNINIYHLQALR